MRVIQKVLLSFYFRRYTLQLESARPNLGYNQSLTFFWILYFCLGPQGCIGSRLCVGGQRQTLLLALSWTHPKLPDFGKLCLWIPPYITLFCFLTQFSLFTKKKRVASNFGMSLKPQIQVHWQWEPRWGLKWPMYSNEPIKNMCKGRLHAFSYLNFFLPSFYHSFSICSSYFIYLFVYGWTEIFLLSYKTI